MRGFILCLIFALPGVGAPAEEFQELFDGETLTGWAAPDMSYWSVEDGAITAQSTPENPCAKNQFLVWQGGEVGDFELELQFRLENNHGNSGIQFRSVISPDGRGVGYQADILPGGDWLCAVCDENTGRETLTTPNGHKTVFAPDGTKTTTRLPQRAALRDPGEWNEYRIVAVGHRIALQVNGVQCAELIDDEVGEFDPTGILALQLRSGDPMKVQFKDIRLKRMAAAEE